MSDKQSKSQGGGWIKTSQKGNKYMSCNIEINGKKVYFSMVKNTYKEEGSKQPDYKIFLSDYEQPAQQQPTDYPQQNTGGDPWGNTEIPISNDQDPPF